MARYTGEAYGVRLHQLMPTPRITVVQCGFLRQVLSDPPTGGSLAWCALHGGIVWSTTAPTYAEAQDRIFLQFTCLIQFSGDPPGCGLPVWCALHRGLVRRTTAASHDDSHMPMCTTICYRTMFGCTTRWWVACVLRGTRGDRMEYDCANSH
eukprot:457258-Pyramimonas_sp.AAC.1